MLIVLVKEKWNVFFVFYGNDFMEMREKGKTVSF